MTKKQNKTKQIKTKQNKQTNKQTNRKTINENKPKQIGVGGGGKAVVQSCGFVFTHATFHIFHFHRQIFLKLHHALTEGNRG